MPLIYAIRLKDLLFTYAMLSKILNICIVYFIQNISHYTGLQVKCAAHLNVSMYIDMIHLELQLWHHMHQANITACPLQFIERLSRLQTIMVGTFFNHVNIYWSVWTDLVLLYSLKFRNCSYVSALSVASPKFMLEEKYIHLSRERHQLWCFIHFENKC